MYVFLQKAQQQGRAGMLRVLALFRAERTMRAARIAFLGLCTMGVAFVGWQSALIASGLREGVVHHILPQSLPLLFSGALYIDRFAALFGVILCAYLLLVFTEGSRGALKAGLLAALFVSGVITASTPLTLIAWLIATTVYAVQHTVQRERRGLVVSMGAIGLGVLLLSGGAFLADMTIVSSVSAQLPMQSVFLALVLLFSGALWSARSLTGAYVLIPVYITLRMCLFFLAGAPALVLALVSLVAVLAALHVARTGGVQAWLRSSVFLLFMSAPLAMLAVEAQMIDAVQCFLFGGLAVVSAGLIGGFPAIWPKSNMQRINIFARFIQSALPGTFMGMGALLLFAGFAVLAQISGPFELVYLTFLALVTLCTFIFLSRTQFAQTVRGGSFPLSGGIQAVLLGGGGIFFAQILAYLGTTIGGSLPDARIEVVFESMVLSLVPAILFVVSAVVVFLFLLVKHYQPAIWNRLTHVTNAGFAWFNVRAVRPALIAVLVSTNARSKAQLTSFVTNLEQRSVHMTMRQHGMLIFALFIVTLIVLF